MSSPKNKDEVDDFPMDAHEGTRGYTVNKSESAKATVECNILNQNGSACGHKCGGHVYDWTEHMSDQHINFGRCVKDLQADLEQAAKKIPREFQYVWYAGVKAAIRQTPVRDVRALAVVQNDFRALGFGPHGRANRVASGAVKKRSISPPLDEVPQRRLSPIGGEDPAKK